MATVGTPEECETLVGRRKVFYGSSLSTPNHANGPNPDFCMSPLLPLPCVDLRYNRFRRKSNYRGRGPFVAEHFSMYGPIDEERYTVPGTHSKFTLEQIFVIVVLFYSNFLFACSNSLMPPFFPHEADAKGVSPSFYSLVFGAFELAVFVLSLVCGKLLSVVSPKFVFNLGIFVAGACCIMFGCLEYSPPCWIFFTLAFALKFFEGAGTGACFTSVYTFSAIEFPRCSAAVLTATEFLYGIGMIAGPVIGGALYQVGGYFLPFVSFGSLQIFGSILGCFLLPYRNKLDSGIFKDWTQLMFYPGFAIDVILCFNSFIIIGFNDATLEPHIRQFGLRPLSLGIVFITFGGIFALSSPFWGFMAERLNNARLLSAFGSFLCMISFLLVGPAPFISLKTCLSLVVLSQILLGFGTAAKIVSPFVQSLKDTLRRGYPDHVSTFGAVSCIFSSVTALGSFMGPIIGGLCLNFIGYRRGTLILLIAEVFVGLLVTIHLIWDKFKRNSSTPLYFEEEVEILSKLPNKCPRGSVSEMT